MVSHVAETEQIVACDFRAENAATARENFEFIEQCKSLCPKTSARIKANIATLDEDDWQPTIDK